MTFISFVNLRVVQIYPLGDCNLTENFRAQAGNKLARATHD